MEYYATKEALVNARAAQRHQENLKRLQDIGATSQKVSDIDIEREIAAESLIYMPAQYAKNEGLPEGFNAWIIRGFGYTRS